MKMQKGYTVIEMVSVLLFLVVALILGLAVVVLIKFLFM